MDRQRELSAQFACHFSLGEQLSEHAACHSSVVSTQKLPLAPVSRYYLVLGPLCLSPSVLKYALKLFRLAERIPLMSSRNRVIRMLHSY